ncbi:glycoside hydrolase family 15 protein [Nocardia abscessus]|uniref:glycoside hydrolase family 15 protein n=1 Tax=Nocardia abscessus TaxID=120957 RepID=UPI0034D5D74A
MDRWRSTRAQIRAFIEGNCFSSRRGCYVRYAGGEELDVAVLLGLLYGYADGSDPRMRATVEVVDRELRHGPFVYRYTGEDGVQGAEGAFLACSFWFAESLARIGRVERAIALTDELIGQANDVGLYSEEIDRTPASSSETYPKG